MKAYKKYSHRDLLHSQKGSDDDGVSAHSAKNGGYMELNTPKSPVKKIYNPFKLKAIDKIEANKKCGQTIIIRIPQ